MRVSHTQPGLASPQNSYAKGAILMAYSDFTLDKVRKILGVTFQQENLFETVSDAEVSPWLHEALQRGKQFALLSEKARSEFLVAPILLASRELTGNRFAIYSGERLDVAPEKGLVGECDFILTASPPMPVLEYPIVIILEAKKQDMEGGLGQCAAQMVGAQLFNKGEGRKDLPIFGCVTTGETWQFLKLTNTILSIDKQRYYIVNIGTILGVFKAIMASHEAGSLAA
jgi:hypothetical protein